MQPLLQCMLQKSCMYFSFASKFLPSMQFIFIFIRLGITDDKSFEAVMTVPLFLKSKFNIFKYKFYNTLFSQFCIK